jgi:hypothetical protein
MITDDEYFEYFTYVSTSLRDALELMISYDEYYMKIYTSETEYLDFHFVNSPYKFMQDFVDSDLPREFIKEVRNILQPYIDKELFLKEQERKQEETEIRNRELSELKRLKAKYES